jgi:hypothetical protein
MDKKMNESASFDIDKAADMITEELMPKKSSEIYEQQYEGFVKWCMVKRVENYNENCHSQIKTVPIWYKMLDTPCITTVSKKN